MKTATSRVNASEVLRTAPPNQSFLFFEDIGKYTGIMAANLAEFCKDVKIIDIKSVKFHFERGN